MFLYPRSSVGTRATVALEDGTSVSVELARDAISQARGLSGRIKLEPDSGMLFLFELKEIRKFWMVGMNFDLDIIWLDNGKIINISKNVPAPKSASDMPSTVSSIEPIDGVLEVIAGFSDAHNLAVGDLLEMPTEL